ncbi:uncharacterized protein KD926_006948 [Aspergillus affinis]|uniref:uncharacterized protein n=1 Tax=Aspergillus affinis TaxID=1070780 RepID=UPI0022FDE32C|nr:uncharacterized protein KD926_006948 [Aspergillus affinis]KAI9041372.1 hypothetical protein KD926_006948 [Aspergillus affinis]
MDSTHSSSLSPDNPSNLTESQHSSATSVSTQPKIEVSVWFSVFIGNPDSTGPRFEHARFDGKIPKKLFVFQRSFVGTDREGQDFREQLSILHAIVSLSLTFADEMFDCVQEGCIVCKSGPVSALIHRPLCVTETGYHQLFDFQETYRLMSTIASHTESIKQTGQISWSIGSFMSDRPYVCSLALPVCTTDGECFRIATERAQDYIEGIIDGDVLPQPFNCAKIDKITEAEKRGAHGPSTHSSNNAIAEHDNDFQLNSADLSVPDSPLKEGLYNIGTTMFVGTPSLQVKHALPQGELSCLVLSTTFPRSVMPERSKNQADAAIDYCRVSGYYEQDILHHLDLRCAVCPNPVAASTLVHFPIAFPRTHGGCLEDGSVRKLIMELCRFVNGTWNYPEMNAALGFGNDAHIFELVVPICETKSICEKVARISAREFLRLLTPSGTSLPFPGLEPDTNLAAVHAMFRSFSEEEPEPAECLVEKIAPECLISEDEPERKDSPKDSTLSVSSLRLWFENCHMDQEVSRESLSEKAQKEEDQDQVEVEKPETDDSVVWVFDLVDPSHPFDENEGNPEAKITDPVIEDYQTKEMFQTLLTWDFWLLYEAITSQATFDGTDFSENKEAKDGYKHGDGDDKDNITGTYGGYKGYDGTDDADDAAGDTADDAVSDAVGDEPRDNAAFSAAFTAGFTAAYHAFYNNDGLDNGRDSDSEEGSDEGCNNDYDVGHEEGEDTGYDDGYEDGFKEGRKEKDNIEDDEREDEGADEKVANGDSAYEKGYDEGYGKGYDKGWDQGHADGVSGDGSKSKT